MKIDRSWPKEPAKTEKDESSLGQFLCRFEISADFEIPENYYTHPADSSTLSAEFQDSVLIRAHFLYYEDSLQTGNFPSADLQLCFAD